MHGPHFYSLYGRRNTHATTTVVEYAFIIGNHSTQKLRVIRISDRPERVFIAFPGSSTNVFQSIPPQMLLGIYMSVNY